MPAFQSLTFTEAKKRADNYSESTGRGCFVYRTWDTDTAPGGGFDWCSKTRMWVMPEVKQQDIVYHTEEGHYE